MKRSMSTLLTTLLLTAAIVPNAMAQMPRSNPSVRSSIQSVTVPTQSTTGSTTPTTTKPDNLSEPAKNQLLPVTAINPESARPSVDSSYPAYCPFLPAGAKPGNWEYREAMEKCLHGV